MDRRPQALVVGMTGSAIDPAELGVRTLLVGFPAVSQLFQVPIHDFESLLHELVLVPVRVMRQVDRSVDFDADDRARIDLEGFGHDHAVTPLE